MVTSDNQESFRALMENIPFSTDADGIGICLGAQADSKSRDGTDNSCP